MTRDINLPYLDPIDDSDSDSDEEEEENESDRLVVACPQPIVAPLKAQATPLPPIPDYRNYITQDEEISSCSQYTFPKHHVDHHGQINVILLPNVSYVIPN